MTDRIGWTPREVAEMLDLNYGTVLEQIRAGVIPADKFGNTHRIPNSWVQERRGADLLDNDLLAALAFVLRDTAKHLAQFLPKDEQPNWRRSA